MFREDPGEALDLANGCPQIMGDGVGEGLQLGVHGLEGFVICERALLRSAPLGQVTSDLDEPGEGAGPIAHCGEDDVAPELRAVLPDALALFLESSFAGGKIEIALRLSTAAILGRIEHREMLAYDLLARIALDLLRATVPASDISVRIEHEDRIVSSAIEELVHALVVHKGVEQR